MDPVTAAILAAIAAGAAGGVTEVSKQGFVDAYASLKDLLRRTFSQDSPLIEAVEKLEQNPDSEGRKLILQEEVKAAKADQQPDITQAAQALLDQLKAQPGGEQLIQNSKNVVVDSSVITGGGDLHVGDKTTIINNYYHSAQYQELEAQRKELQARFEQTQKKTEQYPGDEDFKIELLHIAKARQEVEKKLEEFKAEVIRLAETFTKIPLNTERLQLARQHFEAGDYPAARAILDAEMMGQELETLLQRKTRLEEQQAENEQRLRDKAHEFLILARLTAIDFNQPNCFEKTKGYFEQSLKAAHTLENTFAYAYFLNEHNRFNTALPWYEEALKIVRTLAKDNPKAYLPNVATTLNNLGNLQARKNDFTEAEKSYREALGVRRALAKTHLEAYLPD